MKSNILPKVEEIALFRSRNNGSSYSSAVTTRLRACIPYYLAVEYSITVFICSDFRVERIRREPITLHGLSDVKVENVRCIVLAAAIVTGRAAAILDFCSWAIVCNSGGFVHSILGEPIAIPKLRGVIV